MKFNPIMLKYTYFWKKP